MKKSILLLSIFALTITQVNAQQGMGVGNNNPQEMLDVTGAIKIGTTSTTNAGTIRWNGTNFQGYDGIQWVNLDGSGGTNTDNQNLTGATLTGTSLQIDIEDGTSATVNLSALVDDADADDSNELQTLSISGSDITLSNGGGTVSIPAGGDTDWTVSGNNQYSAVSGNVGIGTTTPDAKLEVYNPGGATLMKITKDGSQNSSLFFVNGNNNNQGTTLNLNSAEHFIVQNNISDKDIFFNVNDGGSATDVLFIDGGESQVGVLNTSPDYELDVSGDISIDNSLVHNNDANTFLSFTPDRIQLFAGSGSSPRIDIQNSANEVAVNEAGLQWDFRVEGDTDSDLLFVDGSADNVGVGTSAPSAKLEVAGQLKITGGSPGLNKVLTSDATGLGSWVDPGTLISNDGDWTISGNNQYSTVSGNVGVGTANPTAKLEVLGTFESGQLNNASGANSVALGAGNFAAATSIAAGNSNLASGTSSVSLGDDNSSSGTNSVTLGTENTASNQAAVAVGQSSIASGSVAFAAGLQNSASGARSVAMGEYNTASGTGAVALGNESVASGQISVALGRRSMAEGSGSVAMGFENVAKSMGEVALGVWNSDYTPSSTTNWIGTDRLLTVGNGISNFNRSNALTIYKDGRMNINDAYTMPTADGTSGYVMSTDGSGNVSWSDPSALISNDGDWTVSGSNIYAAVSGNVGIGATAPVGKLDVTGSSHTGINIDAGSSTNTYIDFRENGALRGNIFWDGTNDVFRINSFSTTTAINASGGNVGVGTSSPNSKLDVVGSVHSWNTGFGMSSFTDGARNFANFSSDNHAGTLVGQNMYSNGGTLKAAQTHATLAGSGIFIPGNQQANQGAILFYTNPPAATTGGANLGGFRMALTTSGRLGIGTSNPIAPLHVENSNDATYGNFTFYALNQYTNTPNNPTSCCGGNVNNVAIHANGRVMAWEFDAFSDARIKDVIQVSDSEQDLNKLLGIEITDYRMKDKAKDIKTYKKVIAQQVEKIYPEAVSKITDVVPNIYSLASIENGFVALEADVEIGDRIKLILDSGTEMVSVTKVEENGFMIDSELNEQAFIYGTEVDDFRTVDYEAISMLNVSATQELFKLISQLKSSNEELEQKLSDYSSLKADVEILKEALGIDLQSSK